MRFATDRDILVDTLSKVQGVCSQKSTLPVLSCCLLEVDEQGDLLEVHGTDLDISVSTSCAADVVASGRVALPAKRLFDTVRSLPEGPVELAAEPNHWVTLRAAEIEARLAGHHPDEYPQLPEVGDGGSLKAPSAYLQDMIKRTFFSISTDEARASFMGAFLRVTEEDNLQMVSTDGHRLSKVERSLGELVDAEGAPVADPGQVPDAMREGIIIPRKGLTELKRALEVEGLVELIVQGDDLVVLQEDTRLTIRLIPGRFPNFAQVIPRKSEHLVNVSRDAILAALKRAANYTAKTGNTRLTAASDGTLEVHAFDPEVGEFKEPVPCEYTGEGVSAGYNYRYLLEVLGVIEGATLDLEITDTESPTVLRDPQRDDTLFIVMPMQF